MRCPLAANIDGAQAADLPAMIATLGSYDRMFGPRHITTLSLAAYIAEVLWGLGQPQTARPLLERVVRDLKQSAGRTPDKLALASELSAQLQQGLSRLSPELREAVILRDLQGLDYSEIQTVLEVPEGTVKSRINRGRIELARILEEMGLRPQN